jgi:putative ABC transport system substrate-binding protein
LDLVDSFNQPRGNLTGVFGLLGALGPKQLELLHELLPNLLLNPSNLNSQIDTPAIQAAADAMGQRLEVLTASTENELETAFTAMVRQRVDAPVVKPDPFLISQRERLVALAAHHAIPAIYSLRVFVNLGGLISSDLWAPPPIGGCRTRGRARELRRFPSWCLEL